MNFTFKKYKRILFFYYVKEISDNRKNLDESHLNIDGMSKWFNINWDEYKIQEKANKY